MKRAKTTPKELPSRYLRSSSGRTYSYVMETSERDRDGNRLYKLKSLVWDVRPSERRWTAEELISGGGRFLKNPPTAAMIRKAKDL